MEADSPTSADEEEEADAVTHLMMMSEACNGLMYCEKVQYIVLYIDLHCLVHSK